MHDPMARVSRFLDGGQLNQAEQFCREVIETESENINMLGILGAILLKQRKINEAEKYLKRTIDLAPTFAKPHEDLGTLYLSENKPEEAATYFEKSAQLDPGQVSALFGLANAQLQMDKRQEAEDTCDAILDREPDNIEALRLLAQIATVDKRYVIAEGLLRKIAKSAPEQSAAYHDLGRFLVNRSRLPEATNLFRKAIEINPSNYSNHLALGNTLSILGLTVEALAAFEKCLELEPREPSALLGRGHLLRIQGRRDEATASYKKCADLQPEFGAAFWCLASLKDHRFSDEDVSEMQRRIETGGLNAESEINFRFALARAYENLGDFEAAWRQYQQGNEQKRARVQYDPVNVETKHDRLIEVFTAGLLQEKILRETVSPTPIFILGVPRSGSTLIEQILASHSMVEGAGELPQIIMMSAALGKDRPGDLAYPELLRQIDREEMASLGKGYIERTAPHRHEDLPYFTDKMPANFSHAGFIQLILPNAKIIDARRNPLDACVGNYRQLFAQGKKQSYDLQELGEYYLQYRRMMDHWDAVLPDRILHVQYEDVVSDLDSQVRRILEFCGLSWEDACLNFFESDRAVNTASAEQVREPIYKDAVGYWKNYESHLGELLEVLAPVL
jgi:tetratricopeptide (TPR) repeat protein